MAVSRLRPAAPSVDRAVVWIDTVKRGDFIRQVRGSGVLTPEDIRWIPAQTAGRVEDIILRAGAVVKPDTVIMVLSSPDLSQAMRDAELAYQGSKAAFDNKKADLESALLAEESSTESIKAQYNQANFRLVEMQARVAAEVAVALKTARFRAEALQSAQVAVQNGEEMWRKLQQIAFGVGLPARQYDPLEPLLAERALLEARTLYLD